MATNQLAVVKTTIDQAKTRFVEMKNGLDFSSESLFAFQAVSTKDYSLKIAMAEPLSLKMAMANVAAIGLTLNPARGLAYFVPRGGKIVLDISYRGLIQLATTSGAILWAKAEIVHQNDTFEYLGVDVKPSHRFNPFDENRGKIVGVYCIAKLATGGYLTDVMNHRQIEQVRGTSMAKSGPWVDWFDEMAKKTVIKRASKTWPQTSSELSTAIEVLNEHEGLTEEYLAGVAEATPEQQQTAEALPDAQVPDDARELTTKVIARAVNAGAWAAAGDYLTDRYQADPPLKAWAQARLDEAQMQAIEEVSAAA